MFGHVVPELPATECLPEHWQDMGYAHTDALGGVSPFQWQEIDAYLRVTNCDLAPCEAQCLMDMSRAYVRAVQDTHPLSKSPMERADG